MRGFRFSPSLVISMLALFFSLAGVGVAATGDPFVLGQSNTATTKTSLNAKLGGSALQLTNNSIKPGATALTLNTLGGPPLVTNTPTTATNLSADYLDGIDSTAFAEKGDLRSASGAIAEGTSTQTSSGSLGLTLTCTSMPQVEVTVKNIGSSLARYGQFGIGGTAVNGNGTVDPSVQTTLTTLGRFDAQQILWAEGSETVSLVIGNVTGFMDSSCRIVAALVRTT